MVNVSEKKFEELKGKGIGFPVCIKIHEDEMRAIEIFHFLNGKYKFILEDRDREQNLKYSYLGFNPHMALKFEGNETTVLRKLQGDKFKEEKYDKGLFEAIRQYIHVPFDELDTKFPFLGGAIGYIGYDFVTNIENVIHKSDSEKVMDIPEAFLMVYKNVMVFDHEKNILNLIYNVEPTENMSLEQIEKYLNKLYESIKCNMAIERLQAISLEEDKGKNFTSNFTKDQFCNLVNKAKDYVKKGDVFQVVLSQRFSTKTKANPFDIYRRLRVKNPSPYMFYIDFQNFKIIGASPESLVKVRDKEVVTNPIAGTRKRGRDSKEDAEIARELLQDPKERAEHVMLVDLGRNDVGKVSKFGSIDIRKFMKIENYSKVMHIVSEVKGQLKDGLDSIDAFKACFPAGTVSGAPKVRAMEIINELENNKRGFYAGAIGYFGFNGNMDMAIAIRTLLYKDNTVYIGAGAGIVYDSDPLYEYNETLNKAKGIMEVV